MEVSERTPRDWFDDAERCYLERHQGCAWCGGSHRVFRTEADLQISYYCNGCDFHVAHDPKTGRYFFIPGEKRASGDGATLVQY